jgi:hypothetical protein
VSDTINRQTEVTRLSEVLANPGPGLSVCAISGPGGVGKTYLLAHVLAGLDLAAAGYVQGSVDASNPQTRGDFFGILEALFRPGLPEPADPRRDYFPRLREVAALHRRLTEAARAELTRQGAPERLKQGVTALLRAGHALNRTLPRAREFLEVAARNLPVAGAVASVAGAAALDLSGRLSEADARAALDEAWAALEGLQSLASSTALPGPVRDLLGVTRRNRVRRELFRVTAEALLTDLSAALGGTRGKQRLQLTQGAIPGARRLLLVLDDYELLAPLLGDFLIGALVPELARARFDTVLVIVCRDDLEATHVGWAQHGKRFLREQIRLAAFDEPTALRLLADAGVAEGRRQALYEATQGYPFLLSLVIEEAAIEADSALFLRRFFDRTTRWMSPAEQAWFERVCYLERIDEDTLARVFPGEDVRPIQDWFEREPSIRDPTASFFRVRPLIRDKVLRYLEVRSPSRHRERERQARPLTAPS